MQEFKLKKMATGRKKTFKKAVETETVLPEHEEGSIPAAAATTVLKNTGID